MCAFRTVPHPYLIHPQKYICINDPLAVTHGLEECYGQSHDSSYLAGTCTQIILCHVTVTRVKIDTPPVLLGELIWGAET